MLSTTFGLLAAYTFTGTIAASNTVVSFYTDNTCTIRTGGFNTIPGDNLCHTLDTPDDTVNLGAGHAGPASCITYYQSATCDNREPFSADLFLDRSSDSDNNLLCSGGGNSEMAFIPKGVRINDNTDSCRANIVTISGFAGGACLANVGECGFNGPPDGQTLRCQDFTSAASFRFSQTTSRTDYVAYGFTNADCTGEPAAGPIEQGVCGTLSNIGCVRVSDRDSGTYLEQVGESYDTAEAG